MSMTTEQAEISCLRSELRVAMYEVNRLHNIMQELPEGWHIVTDDGEWTYRATQREAESYAKECSEQGMLAAVVNITAKYQQHPIEDMCTYNGVTPGVDCPHSLRRVA